MSLDQQTAMTLNRRTLELLEEGRARIAQGWCWGALARDREGVPVFPDSPQAVSWCVVGGLGGAEENESLPPAWDDALGALYKIANTRVLALWNDQPDRTQTEVLALYDKAIADMRAKLEEGG